MTIYKINVTQEDLERGMPRIANEDPIAIAIKRAMNLDWVSVGGDGQVTFITGKYYQLPERIVEKIEQIDHSDGVTGRMKPFSFEIDESKIRP